MVAKVINWPGEVFADCTFEAKTLCKILADWGSEADGATFRLEGRLCYHVAGVVYDVESESPHDCNYLLQAELCKQRILFSIDGFKG